MAKNKFNKNAPKKDRGIFIKLKTLWFFLRICRFRKYR